jgi:glutathione S-transferase
MLSTGFVHIYHQILTGKKRAAAKIAYPAGYADNALAEKDPKANAFNCAQRAHAHFTENLTPHVLDLAIAGLRFPLIAAGCGLLWSVGRAVYAYGYVNIGPKARHTYVFSDIAVRWLLCVDLAN